MSGDGKEERDALPEVRNEQTVRHGVWLANHNTNAVWGRSPLLKNYPTFHP